MMLLLDTCVLVYDALDPERIPASTKQAIELAEAAGDLACSDISLWEIAMLQQPERLDPGVDPQTFPELLLDARGVRVLPITPEIAVRSARLPIHRDPADRIIAATAIESAATLVTCDRLLLQAGVARTLW